MVDYLARTNPCPYDITIEGSSKSYLLTKEFGPMFDMACGIAVNNLGHSYLPIIKAARKSVGSYRHINVYGEFNISEQLEYAELLAERFSTLTMANGISEENKVWFCTSGTEANELAMKLATLSTASKLKRGFIALTGGFHGRTLGSLSLTQKELYREPFSWMVKAGLTTWIEPGEEIPKEFKTRSAFFMELVQGEAGVIPLDPEWATYVSNWCRENEVLLVVDEVQTGFGRTGTHFALDQYQGVKPDIITLGKALGGGYPLGAVISSSNRFKSISEENPFTHLSTFGGNPIACAAGIQMFKGTEKKKLLQNVNDGNILAHNVFKESESGAHLRGLGLMLGLVLDDETDIDEVVQNIWKNNVFCGRVLYGSNTIRLYPPLNTTPSDIYNKVRRVEEAVLVSRKRK